MIAKIIRFAIALFWALAAGKIFADPAHSPSPAPCRTNLPGEKRAALVFSSSRAKLAREMFSECLKKWNSDCGAFCLVESGKIFAAETIASDGKAAIAKNLPLGKTSQALVSLMALEMERRGVLKLTSPASAACSLFKPQNGEGVSVENLLSMRAGFDPHYDSLVPRDSTALQLFEIAAQLPPACPPGKQLPNPISEISASCAAYILGYASDPKEKNLKKSFARASREFLFNPIKISSQTYRNFDLPTFGSQPYALPIDGIAAWLSCETSTNPPIADAESIEKRRISTAASDLNGNPAGFSGIWLNTAVGKIRAQISGGEYQGWAHIVVIFPKERAAAAFFARGKSGKPCADMIPHIADMAANPLPQKHYQ